MSKTITITAQQQGEFLAKIAGRLKYFESTTGYIMTDKQGKLYLVEEGREYHRAIVEKELKEVKEIFDVYDRVYGMEGFEPEEFIKEHCLKDREIEFNE